jgi:hypothetical protein
MLRRVLPLLCLLALALPTAAFAQSDNPFGPLNLPPADTTPEPVATQSSSSDDNGGLKSWQEVLIILAGGVLIVGIGWAIVADARQNAPTGDETEGKTDAMRRQEADHKRRKAQARAAGKRQRAARRRNR